MNYAETIKAANALTKLLPFLSVNPTKEDYQDALDLVEYLIEHDPDNPLIDMLTAKIDRYENASPEFAEFNARVASIPSGVALLRTLMDQHKLTQSDLENEIGKKSLVSRILSGQRSLTLDHMRALAKRFNIPVSTFVGD
ncbi:helix-turn-helix domain-containing protein [Enterobacter sp. ECC-175]|uniref:helix-turn-helix domain-containing protein n=1 Tax=unclassified Enterobacter TaxID=2608935 RepID=UPI000D4457DC|nr:helix-turn-helix domain-containing protein [Enterobacter sp. RIT 418]RAU30738.1 transcriptional regulator [Enterobacter sp. RIT 418]